MRGVLLATSALVLLTACGSGRPGAEPTADGLEAEVVVLAAASLTDSFTELAAEFEAAHPGTTVRLTTGGSSALAQQVVAGAPADVFASASPETMAVVTDAGLAAAAPTPLARSSLVLAVPAGNPGQVTELADLADPDRVVALCEEQVPCGAAAARVLAQAGVVASPDTLERDVRAVLAKLTLGEVDAGLVYRTDALAAGDAVEAIALDSPAAATDYLVAPLAQAPSPSAAVAFVAHVTGEPGRRVLAGDGFALP